MIPLKVMIKEDAFGEDPQPEDMYGYTDITPLIKEIMACGPTWLEKSILEELGSASNRLIDEAVERRLGREFSENLKQGQVNISMISHDAVSKALTFCGEETEDVAWLVLGSVGEDYKKLLMCLAVYALTDCWDDSW